MIQLSVDDKEVFMSTNWSTKIQGIETLNSHREIRFNDKNINTYVGNISLMEDGKILEIGCGPGTFSRKLAIRLPKSNIVGLDLDDNFIEYCKKEAKDQGLINLDYLVGNALSLPFENNSFNLCTSHTVIEHLPNIDFLSEQYRVLKEDGTLVVMYVQMDNIIKSKEDLKPSMRTLDLMDKVSDALEIIQKDEKIGKYYANPQEVLKSMELVGFKDIRLEIITDIRCVDDARHSIEEKKTLMVSELNSQIEFVNMAMAMEKPPLSEDEYDELITLMKADVDKRLEMINSKEHLWDFIITPIVMLIGRK